MEPPKKRRPPRAPGLLEAQPLDFDKVPRSDVAEEGLLSCFLANAKELLPHFCEIGNLSWFYHEGNKLIASELLAMSDEGLAVDVVTASQRFIDLGLMDKIGGPSKLAELLNFVPTPSLFTDYCEILRDKFTRREAVRQSQELRALAEDSALPIPKVSEGVAEKTSAIISLFQEREKFKTTAEHVDDFMTEWQNMASGNVKSAKPTRWTQWNLRLGGLLKAYYLLKAPRGTGKSSLMHDLCLQTSVTATDKEPSAIFSYEMSEKSIIKRCISNLSMVPNQYLFSPDTHKPTPEIEKQISRAACKIASSPLHIIYVPGLTIQGIQYRVRKIRPALFGVDYVQRIPLPAGAKPSDRPAIYGDFSRALFDLRNELDNTAFMLSHTNENGEASWSAALENDADLALLIDDDEIKVTKNRNGRSGIHLDLELDGSTFRFDSPPPPKK